MSVAFDDPIGSWATTLFCPLGADGVYARTALFERVIDGLGRLHNTILADSDFGRTRRGAAIWW